MPSASRTGQVVEQIVWCGRRIRFAAPCLGQFPDLARRPAELPAERADECGIAAESKIDGKIDQALAPAYAMSAATAAVGLGIWRTGREHIAEKTGSFNVAVPMAVYLELAVARSLS